MMELQSQHAIGIPSRVVSLVPSITRSMMDFGLGSRIIGITEYCEQGEFDDVVRDFLGGGCLAAKPGTIGKHPLEHLGLELCWCGGVEWPALPLAGIYTDHQI